MGLIKCLVSEHSINGEEFSRSERHIICNGFQYPGRDSGCVCSKNVFFSLFFLPLTVISLTSKTSNFVYFFNFMEILLIIDSSLFGFWDKEGIMSISGWMSLRLEESIEIPKWRLNISISFHFFKAHLSKYFFELLSRFHENVNVSMGYF